MLTGCGEKKQPASSNDNQQANAGNTDNTASDSNDSTDTTVQTPDVPKDTVELTMTLVGDKQETDTELVMEKINEYMADKLNIKLNLQVYGWGDPYEQKINTMLASGEPFDICFTANWVANYYKNAAAGYFMPLNDYLKKYPAIYEICGRDFVDGSAIDGINYGVPTNKEQAHNWGYLIMKSIVDEFGIDVSSLKTMEDLEPWFEKVKKEKPDITPLLIVGGDSPFQFLDWDRVSDDNVPGALYSDNRDTTIINHFLAPESIDMYKKLRDYYKKGWIHPDAATMENTAEQMKTGKFFAVEQSLKPGKDAEMSSSTGIEWVQVDITKPVMSNRETTGALLAIPAASKNPERAFRFIEALYTDVTLRNMLNFGIEGVHYTKNDDGRITQTQAGVDRYNMGPGWRYGDQFKDYLLSNEAPDKWEKFKAYNEQGLVLNSLGFVFNEEPVSSQSSACKNVVTTYSRQLMCGAVDVDPIIKKFEKELKDSGVDELIAEMQRQYDDWRAKMGK